MSTFTCAISHSPTFHPCITPSGLIYDKPLLLSLLAQNGGLCPTLKSPLTSTMLIDVVSNLPNTSLPEQVKNVSGTSFPVLLSTLQTEWDVLTLELYNLRVSLEETRRELSQSLYQNDAAVRVIARVTEERDYARERLGKENTISSSSNGMDVDASSTEAKIPQEHVDVMVSTFDELAVIRKSKKNSKDKSAATTDTVKSFTADSKKGFECKEVVSQMSLVCGASGDGTIIGLSGDNASINVYDISTKKLNTYTTNVAKATFTSLSTNTKNKYITTTTADNILRLHDGSKKYKQVSSISYTETVVTADFHPSGLYVIVTLSTGTIDFLSITKNVLGKIGRFVDSSKSNTAYTAGCLHVDGLIYLAGTSNGEVKIWDVKNQVYGDVCVNEGGAANGSEGVILIKCSYNGYTFASCDGAGLVSIWDLRKKTVVAQVNVNQEHGKVVHGITFDESCKMIAVTTESNVVVFSVKSKEVVMVKAIEGGGEGGVAFGKDGKFLAVAKGKGVDIFE